MTNRMLKNSEFLKLLHQCPPKQRIAILKTAKPSLINAVCDCITNIVHQKVPITSQQKGVLAKKKKVLRELSNSKTGTGRKKKLLVQHGNGILKTILGTILSALGSL